MAFRCPPEFTLRNALRVLNSASASVALSSAASSSRTSYRAALCTELGKPLQLSTLDRTPLESKQVRVSIDYSAVNFADILVISGKYQEKRPVPFVPGWEFSGRITEVGNEVAAFKAGTTVLGISPGNGSYMEEVVLTEEELQKLYRIDEGLSQQEGTALIGSYSTAYLSLVHRAHIKQGDIVLVTAAAGALGLAAVDLAANVFGATVIGVCGGAEKCRIAESRGARHTIDYSSEDMRGRIKELTQSRGVDIAVDIVGGKVLEDCLKSMAFEGRLLTLGYAGGELPKLPANLILVKNCSVLGVWWGNYATQHPAVFQDSITSVVQLWKDRKIRPHVGKVFPLTQVNEALQYIASRKSTGKVLLDCRPATA